MKDSKKFIWKPVIGQIMTRWARDVSTDNPLPEYPRPQLRRDEWLSLNGRWIYSISSSKSEKLPPPMGNLLVPFPIESALSGVKRKLKPKEKLWYYRTFKIPERWTGKKILLHFGAVDWECKVWVNHKLVGSHKGGNTPFTFDISESIRFNKDNGIIVAVLDPTNKGGVERGKQTLRPFGIKYTAVSGIWQTVWLEMVPNTYIKALKILPSLKEKSIFIVMKCENQITGDNLNFIIKDEGNEIINSSGNVGDVNKINITNPKPWSPESPFLYDLIIQIKRNKLVLDEIQSYFGMRDITVKLDENGHHRIFLNNKKLFQYGTLDQGYWPDGLYTAPIDEALKYDIKITKELGFNMIRKHGKIEPARWYYYCDKLGILVWQDMPSGGSMLLIKQLFGFLYKNRENVNKRKESQKQGFLDELNAMIEALYNHPSLVVWVPFNEGWGQFETKKIVKMIREKDPSRLINNASGWHDQGVGDICDCHNYPNPALPKNIRDRAAVLGEFGGLGLKFKGHLWHKKFKWAYKSFSSSQELLEKYTKLLSELKRLIPKGLCAAVYTQITDVEGEINGLLTYDREIIKMDKNKLKEINLGLYNFKL